MKKSTLLLLALAAGAPLLAQAPGLTITNGDASATLYGILDIGVANVAHTLDFSTFVAGTNPTLTKAGNTSAFGVMNGGISQTRWGIKGGVGLGEGWKGVFNLESAINLQDGQLSSSGLQYYKSTGNGVSADTSLDGGALFGRNANVGLSHETYGTLTFGRHTSLMLDEIPAFDALQGAQMFTPIGFSGSYGGGGATDNSRVDSSLKYKLKIAEVTLGLVYKFGGATNNSSAKNVTEFNAKWEHGPFAIMAAYQSCKDTSSVGNPSGAVNANALGGGNVTLTLATAATAVPAGFTQIGTTAAGLPIVTGSSASYVATLANHTAVYEPIGTVTVTAEDTKATMVTARYKVGDFLITAGYEKEAYTNPSNPTYDATWTSIYNMPIGLWTTKDVTGTMAVLPAVNVIPFTIGGAAMEKDLTVFWGGIKYDVTKNFNIGVSYYHVAQNDFSNGTGTAADLSGTTKYMSALLDYNLSKAFDIYLGYMNTKGDGGMVAGYTYDNNTITGLGLRLKF